MRQRAIAADVALGLGLRRDGTRTDWNANARGGGGEGRMGRGGGLVRRAVARSLSGCGTTCAVDPHCNTSEGQAPTHGGGGGSQHRGRSPSPSPRRTTSHHHDIDAPANFPQLSDWRVGRGEGVWHKASAFGCLPLAAPIGLSPLLVLTLCGPERVLVVRWGGGGGTRPRCVGGGGVCSAAQARVAMCGRRR